MTQTGLFLLKYKHTYFGSNNNIFTFTKRQDALFLRTRIKPVKPLIIQKKNENFIITPNSHMAKPIRNNKTENRLGVVYWHMYDLFIRANINKMNVCVFDRVIYNNDNNKIILKANEIFTSDNNDIDKEFMKEYFENIYNNIHTNHETIPTLFDLREE